MSKGVFKVGDVVSLKSANQPMTVEAVSEGFVKAVWFGYESQLHREEFKADVLKRVSPPGPVR